MYVISKSSVWLKPNIFQKIMHEKVEFWQPKPVNSCKNWRVSFNVHYIKVCICDHTYLLRHDWENATKIAKIDQVMAILKFVVAVSDFEFMVDFL